MNLERTLAAVARSQPDHPAICDGLIELAGAQSYAALSHIAACVAGGLTGVHGLRRHDRVALVMENAPEFYPILFACWRVGLSVVPINAKLHGKEVHWIVQNSHAKLLITSPKAADQLHNEAPAATWPRHIVTRSADWLSLLKAEPAPQADTDPGDEAWVFYTSGTTGRPKGAMLSHRALLFMCHAYMADIDHIGNSDTHLHPAPLTHGGGLYGLACLLRGGNNVILHGFDPREIYDAIASFSHVSFFAAPTMVTRLLNHPDAGAADLRNLKTITYGGAPMYVADLERALKLFGPRLYQLYGQGESPMTITGLSQAFHADRDHPDYDSRLASTGIARTGVSVRVVDEHGADCPAGEVGEIITKSDCLMTGYWDNPEANARALRQGWLWTGDLGHLDAAGFLTLKDRSKDLIISGGTNIYPREVEEVLLTYPGVLECAVVGRPNPDWGEEVIAFVVTGPDTRLTDVDLDAHCLDNIARFKRPKSYRFVTELPKNNYGKVLKTELRRQCDNA
ncbi:MAG: AMP-binding protein [Pseudomonadota bacterium]